MISNELLEEIIDISLRGQYINKKIIQKVFNEIFLNLDEYTTSNFNCLEFGNIDRKTNTFGTYYPEERVIKLDLIESYVYENKNKKLNMLIKNLRIINHLFHEVEHLKQSSKIIKNDLEAKLIMCSKDIDEVLYNDLYDCVPIEKLAFANSWKLVLENILKYPEFKNQYFETYKYINNEYIKNLKMGYYYDEYLDKYDVPLIRFLCMTKQLELLQELGSWNIAGSNKTINNIPVEVKLKYGLPITRNDIDEINKKKIITKSAK